MTHCECSRRAAPVGLDRADDNGEMLIPAKLGAEHHHLGLRRDTKRHPGARHYCQASSRGFHLAFDVAVFEDDQVVVAAQTALHRLIP